MKLGKTLFAVSLLLNLNGLVHAQVTLNIALLGYDGSPMEQAHVALRAGTEILLLAQADEEGKHSLVLPKPGGYGLYAMGAYHETLEIPLIALANEAVNLTIRLAPRFVAQGLDSVWVVVADSAGTIRHLMEKRSDGTHGARVPVGSDTLSYQIRAQKSGTSTVMLAGTQHERLDFSKAGPLWDAASDYFSVMQSSGGMAEITFDPGRLPESEAEAAVEADPQVFADIVAEHWFVLGQSQLETDAFWAMQQGEIDKQEYEAQLERLQAPVRNRIAALQDGPLRQWLLLRFFHSLMPAAADSLLVRQVLNEVAPTSVLWSYFTRRALDASLLIQTIDYRANNMDLVHSYLRRVIDDHADAKVRAQFLLAGVTIAHGNGDEGLKWDYYLQLQGEYAESPQAESARKDFSPERKLQPGKTIPAFNFPALGEKSESYTDELLRGKVFLLDFWGTWCKGSFAQMSELHEAYNKYRDAGFEILSIAMMDDEESIAAFRMGQFPMPWLHSVAESEDFEAVVKAFEISAYPWPILVDKHGTIIALGLDLLKRDLSEELEDVMEPID